MKKTTIAIVIAISLITAVLLIACGNNPEGDRVYELSSVEENEYDYTKDSFRQFNINLFEDASYRVDFQAKGMPVVARENGIYTITDGVLSLERAEDSSELIAGIVSYDAKTGEIVALCKNRADGKTFTATFTQTDATASKIEDEGTKEDTNPSAGFETFIEGTYTIVGVNENDSDYTLNSFLVFTVTFENGNYTVTFKANGAPLQFSETGTYTITDGKMTLNRESPLAFLASAVSYDSENQQLTLQGKGMGEGANYTAIFELQDDGDAGFAAFVEGTYEVVDVEENAHDYTAETFTVFTVAFEEGNYTVAFRPAGAPMQFSETGTYTIANGEMTFTRESERSFLASILSYDSELKQITIECKVMGAGENYTAIFELQE
ncbi:MAG: hypothetical protein WC292_00520 [Clostridia bacterium]